MFVFFKSNVEVEENLDLPYVIQSSLFAFLYDAPAMSEEERVEFALFKVEIFIRRLL